MFYRTLIGFLTAGLLLIEVAHGDQSQQTRYGTLSAAEYGVLLLNGKPTNPSLQGNNFLSFEGKFSIGDSDVVLVQDNGGTACPAELYFVTVNSVGAQISKSFGTCNPVKSLRQIGAKIIVSMPDYRGPSIERAERERAEKKNVVYIYQDGIISGGELKGSQERLMIECNNGARPLKGEERKTFMRNCLNNLR